MSSLSLIIPSYNRIDILIENINYIDSLEIPEDLDIEFIIAVNPNKHEHYQLPKNSRFNIVYHNEYLPIGESILRAYKLGTKDYVYVLGDDDLITPNFFYSILKYLKKDFLCVHFSIFKGKGVSLKKFKHIKFCSSGTFRDYVYKFDEFICKYNLDLGFVSSIIIHRSLIKDNDIPDLRFKGYEFMGPLFLNNYSTGDACYISSPLIIQRDDNNRSYNSDWPVIFLSGGMNFIIEVHKKYSSKNEIKNVLKKRYPTKVLVYNLLWFHSEKRDQISRKLIRNNLNSNMKKIEWILSVIGTKPVFTIIRNLIQLWK